MVAAVVAVVAVCGGLWRFVAVCDGLWRFVPVVAVVAVVTVAVCCSLWRFVAVVAVCGGLWRFVAVCGGSWRFVAVGGSKNLDASHSGRKIQKVIFLPAGAPAPGPPATSGDPQRPPATPQNINIRANLIIIDRTIQCFQDRTEYGSHDPIFPG